MGCVASGSKNSCIGAPDLSLGICKFVRHKSLADMSYSDALPSAVNSNVFLGGRKGEDYKGVQGIVDAAVSPLTVSFKIPNTGRIIIASLATLHQVPGL